MAGYGLLFVGPSLHFWFNCMSRLFPKQDLASTLKKMVMGETLYGPAMTVVFFCLNAGLQGTEHLPLEVYLVLQYLLSAKRWLSW